MIERIIEFSFSHRIAICFILLCLVIASLWAIKTAPLDAVPDLSDPQVIVYSRWQRSPDMIDTHLTHPIITSLLGIPGVRTIRGMSDLGYSFVYVIFEDDVDMEKARLNILERINRIRQELPSDARIDIGPDATSIGWIYQYALVDERGEHDLRELRILQNQVVKVMLESVSGVAEIASVGGLVKQYQLKVYPPLLAETGISLKKLVQALQSLTEEVGGRLLEISNHDYQVRGQSIINNADQIEDAVVGFSKDGKPVQLFHIGYIQVGFDLRRGIADLDGEGETVGGIVVMRHGENALSIIKKIKDKIKEVENFLPEGIHLITTYDRSELIQDSIHTLSLTLTEELLVISLIIIVFLYHFRTAIIPIIVLPVATVLPFLPMKAMNLTTNIMSLGGIAIAMGEIVDAVIVMVENVHHYLARRDILIEEERKRLIVGACKQVGRPLFFSLLIIVVSFLPVFLLEAQEGRLFHPLAYTKTFAMIFSSLLSIILVPALMYFLLRGRFWRGGKNTIHNFFVKAYRPLIEMVLKHKKSAIFLNLLILIMTVPLLWKLERTFMPDLNEGSLLYMPTTLPGMPAKEAGWVLQEINRKLKKFPEVLRVFGKLGRAETATDPAPFSMVEATILLKSKKYWRKGITLEKLLSQMETEMKVLGFVNAWTQPIRTRIDMQTTGIQTPVGIKILGRNIDTIEKIGEEVERSIKGISGTRNVLAERISRGYFLDVNFDLKALGKWGIPLEEAQQYVRYAISGDNVSFIRQGKEIFPLSVQYPQEYIDTIEKVKKLLMVTPAGQIIPLSKVARVSVERSPEMVRNENGFLAGYVFVDVAGVEIGSFVEEAKKAVSRQITLPEGYRIEWSGQYLYQLRASKRLMIVVPLVLTTIFFLLYLTFHSFLESLLVMLSVPYALVGGIWLQWFLGYPMTVAVWIGYIALYAVAVQTGIIMVVYLHEALDRKLSEGKVNIAEIEKSTVEGAVLRLRPKLMTVFTTLIGFIPIMLSTGAGSDIMKPIAAPMIGGMLTSTVHVLFITPCLFAIIKERLFRKNRLKPSTLSEYISEKELCRISGLDTTN